MTIKSIKARSILDSRGKPTVELVLITDGGKFLASVPSGTSKGKHEAFEVEAKKAVKNINETIAPALEGKSLPEQKVIDKSLDKKLGVSAILPISLAIARAMAKEKGLSLWQYIRHLLTGENGTKTSASKKVLNMPKPSVLVIEGGLHGKTKLDIQEFMVVAEGKSFAERFSVGRKIYENLKKNLEKKFGKKKVITGLEGAFTLPISEPRVALDLIMEAAKGYNIKIGLDCAASNISKGKYDTDFYRDLIRDYPILFLEDPFGEEDWHNWRKLKLKMKAELPDLLIVGDDLTVTNPKRIKLAYKKNACNAVIIKPNQIGTVTEAVESAMLAKSYGWKVIVSHRSGETTDDFIADFAVGIGADFIKAGAPSQKERMAKYNRLIKIEKECQN